MAVGANGIFSTRMLPCQVNPFLNRDNITRIAWREAALPAPVIHQCAGPLIAAYVRAGAKLVRVLEHVTAAFPASSTRCYPSRRFQRPMRVRRLFDFMIESLDGDSSFWCEKDADALYHQPACAAA